MPTTPRGYPYPLDGAQPNVPYDMEALARALDSDVAAVRLLADALKDVLDARTSTAGTPGALVSRQSGGFFSAITPTAGSHVTPKSYVDAMTWDAADIVSGILASARLPNINADKITAGVLGTGRIPPISRAMLADSRWVVRTSAVAVPANGTAERVVTFPSGRFDAAPALQLTCSGYSAAVQPSYDDVSATRMTVVLRNLTGAAQSVFVTITAEKEG